MVRNEVRRVIKTWKALSEAYFAHEDALLNMEGALEKTIADAKPAPEADRCGGVNGRIFTPQIKGV